MADEQPKADRRNRWFVETSDDVRRMVRVLAGNADTSAEKFAGAMLSAAIEGEYAKYIAGESERLPQLPFNLPAEKPKPPAKKPRR